MSADLRSQIDPALRAFGLREVARRTGIAQPSISAWLAGRRPMSLSNIERLAEAIGATLHVRLIARRARRASSK